MAQFEMTNDELTDDPANAAGAPSTASARWKAQPGHYLAIRALLQ